jgi:hypothetical protein
MKKGDNAIYRYNFRDGLDLIREGRAELVEVLNG